MKFTPGFNFVLTASLCLIAMPKIHAQFMQQGAKLVGPGAVGAAQQGTVSLSSDGNTAIVGGAADNTGAGAVWVWTRSGGTWTQQGGKLVGTGAVGNGEQGRSVALSSDGNTAIIGGTSDNGNAGAVWIWTRSGGVWTQQGSKLVGTGATGASPFQGASVSISADGNTAAVGATADNVGAGAVWVWTRSAGVWTQQGNKLFGTGAVGNAYQGQSVSLSADGNTVVIGGFLDNGTAGAMWAWTRSGGVWTQQGNKLVGTGAVGNALQGFPVALSGDGNTAIVGGPVDNSQAGAVWVYARPATVVFPREFAVQRLTLENGETLRFGLPKQARVVIQLFNSQGRRISQILDETRDAGFYSVPLSGKAQGAYYLDFRAGDFHRLMKIDR